jgi:hypothetical protein
MNYIPPTYTIPFSIIDDYTEIMRFCRKNNVELYTYEFKWLDHVLKYGIQYKFGGSGNDYGERVYTQAGHMPGWSKPNLKRSPSTKEDIQQMIAKIELTFNRSFHKDDVVLTIMDYTNAPFELDKPYYELQRIENELVEAHELKTGYRPIGNKNKIVKRKIPLMSSSKLWDWA